MRIAVRPGNAQTGRRKDYLVATVLSLCAKLQGRPPLR